MSLPPKTSRHSGPPLAGIVPGDSPAYQKKGALCDRPQTRSLRPGRHLLELDHVTFGILHVDRKTLTVRPITHNRLSDYLDRLAAEIADDLVQVASLDPDAYVVDVERPLDPRIAGGDQVAQPPARP